MKSATYGQLLSLLVQVSFAAESPNLCLASDCSADSTGRSLLQSQSVREKVTNTELSKVMQQLASTLPAGDTKDLFQSFSICGACGKWQRFGEAYDGGYLSCVDNMKNGSLLAAYSIGIEEHDQWSLDIFKTFQIPLYQYDCTVSKPAQSCEQCHFFEACLGTHNSQAFPGKTMWTLDEAVQHSKMLDVPDRSLLMKMDIEGSEWPTLLYSDLQTLKKFRQLVIEFHFLRNEKRHAKYLKVMRHLRRAGFQVIHVHGNNCCKMYEKDGLQIPNIVEVTFDAFAPTLETCENPHKLELDMPNNQTLADIDVARTEP
mmetsp:Transcript_94495/g.225199  ORF Transcript_94495/g.225199 Transcript_94495/m.225199 type:complete len:315 (+) Transcript_94495:83-1027(+)|eukprot:CAMPEP_0181462036 /NCGR_PEP_ID=MMETSP1110-20121109/34185_1 /TAXON_ID=174948 /ORGANISM="Symbiodinium sp., Strain CCMP421" /LENGTH=314 /DNA_ID=CAMNT_0023586677 /DNA_START=83 /DNA_END=1027 /DNA_ORIENTATION=+